MAFNYTQQFSSEKCVHRCEVFVVYISWPVTYRNSHTLRTLYHECASAFRRMLS